MPSPRHQMAKFICVYTFYWGQVDSVRWWKIVRFYGRSVGGITRCWLFVVNTGMSGAPFRDNQEWFMDTPHQASIVAYPISICVWPSPSLFSSGTCPIQHEHKVPSRDHQVKPYSQSSIVLPDSACVPTCVTSISTHPRLKGGQFLNDDNRNDDDQNEQTESSGVVKITHYV